MSGQSVLTYDLNPSSTTQVDQQQFIASADVTLSDYASATAPDTATGFVGLVKTFTNKSQAGALASELSAVTYCNATFHSPRGSRVTLSRVQNFAQSANVKILYPDLTPFSQMKISELRTVDMYHTINRLEEHRISYATEAFVKPDTETVVPITSASWSTQIIDLTEGQARQMNYHGRPVIFIEYDSPNAAVGTVYAIFAYATFEDISDVDLASVSSTNASQASRIGGVIHSVITIPDVALFSVGVTRESWNPAVLVQGQKITTLDNSSQLSASQYASIKHASQLIRRSAMRKLLNSKRENSTSQVGRIQQKKQPKKKRRQNTRSGLLDK